MHYFHARIAWFPLNVVLQRCVVSAPVILLAGNNVIFVPIIIEPRMTHSIHTFYVHLRG